MELQDLKLDVNDYRVQEARMAEQNLFERYGIAAKDHIVDLKKYGLRVRVSEFGEGEPLLILPGNTGDVFPLTPLLAQLKGRRIIAINRPGGGLSEGMDYTKVNAREFAVYMLESVMDAFGFQDVDIVAHSIGAHFSLWLAMDKPGRVRSISMLGNPGNVMKGKPPLMLRLMLMWPFNRLFYKILKGREGDMRLTILKAMGSSQETIDSLPKEIGEAYYYFKRLPHYLVSLTSLFKNAPINIDAAQLSTINKPAQLILGDKDTFASVKVGQSIAEAMPSCTLHVVKDASHLPWLESPEECGELIRDFTNL
jgi:2-hydroxy-6-oxonona-2,4-dienedioate hydrolase